MKIKKIKVLHYLILLIPIASGISHKIHACTTPAPSVRIWDILSATENVLITVDTQIDRIENNITVDFAAVFTTINALNNSYSTVINIMDTTNSYMDSINDSVLLLQNDVNNSQSIIDNILRDINIIQTNDFGGTFSLIQSIDSNVINQFVTISTDLHKISVVLSIISGAQLAEFVALTNAIASISDVVLDNLYVLSELSYITASETDLIESALDIVSNTNSTLYSKVVADTAIVQQDFSGTFTALAALTTVVNTIDSTASILDTLTLTVDLSAIDEQLLTINSTLDVINRQLITTNTALSTINSFLDPISTHLDTINSEVDILNQLQKTVMSDTNILLLNVEIINSFCDVNIGLESATNSVLNQLAIQVMTLSNNYVTVNSSIDSGQATMSIIDNLTTQLNNGMNSDLATILSIESTIESLNGSFTSINSQLDIFNTLQSHVNVLNADINNDLDAAYTISSKTNILYSNELIALSSVSNIQSNISTLVLPANTINSAVNILLIDMLSLQSSVNTVNSYTNTVLSKTIAIESKVGVLDLNVQTIQKTVNTISSNLTLLNVDFQQTWTIIDALQIFANSSNSYVLTIESSISNLQSLPIVVDAGGTFTALAEVQSKALSALSILNAIVLPIPDVAGTYTALDQITKISTSIYSELSSAQSAVIIYNNTACIGTPITPTNIGTTGYTISSGGSYFLTAPVTFAPSTARNAITIAVSNVELDLAGKLLSQSNTTAGVNGIVINSSLSNISIKNGIVQGMKADNIKTGTGVTGILLDDVRVYNAGNHGIDFVATVSNVTISNCSISTCVFNGIALGTGSDILIHDTTCFDNNLDGINMAPGSGVLNRVTIIDCESHGNGQDGIAIEGTTGLQDEIIIDNCSFMLNSGAGIKAAYATRSVFKNNLIQLNGANGISLIGAVSDLEIFDNIIQKNTGVGLYVQSSTALRCSFQRNVFSLNTTNNYLEATNAGAHSILTNYALSATEANNYTISGGSKSTTINKATIGQTTGTFSVYPGKWRNISETTT